MKLTESKLKEMVRGMLREESSFEDSKEKTERALAFREKFNLAVIPVLKKLAKDPDSDLYIAWSNNDASWSGSPNRIETKKQLFKSLMNFVDELD